MIQKNNGYPVGDTPAIRVALWQYPYPRIPVTIAIIGDACRGNVKGSLSYRFRVVRVIIKGSEFVNENTMHDREHGTPMLFYKFPNGMPLVIWAHF